MVTVKFAYFKNVINKISLAGKITTLRQFFELFKKENFLKSVLYDYTLLVNYFQDTLCI